MEPDVTTAGCEIPGCDEKIPGGGNQDNGDWLSDGGYGPWNEFGDPFLKPYKQINLMTSVCHTLLRPHSH